MCKFKAAFPSWPILFAAFSCLIHQPIQAQTLGQALDQPAWSWSYSSAPWYPISWFGAAGGYCAMVGGQGYAGASTLQTTVTGPGTLSFSYAADGVYQYAVLLDGGPVGYLSGFQMSLTSYSISIPAGVHTVGWYCAFDSTSSAVLDNVALGGSGPISPTITTTSPLPNGALGSTYNQTLSATGGITPYTWSVISGGLPPGLSLSTGGVLSGNPSTVTNASFTVAVTGADGGYSYKSLTLAIGTAAPSIGGISPLLGTVGEYRDFGLPVGGSISPYTWSITAGSLPPGMTFSTNYGSFTGTPTVVTNTTFTVQVIGGNGLSDSRVFNFMIGPAITNYLILPGGAVGIAYSRSLMATGGVAPYTWSVYSGGLPAGLNLSSGGVIAGTPSSVTNATANIRATDNLGRYSDKTFTLAITGPPTITTASPLTTGTVGTAYSRTLAATGSTTPYTWSLLSGSLPESLSLSTDGVISGTPSAATNASFTVQVVGANGLATNKAFTLVINPVITNSSPLPAGVLGIAYSQSLVATGGIAPYTWIITSGGLPAGLALSTGGGITGTPSMVTNASFTAQATDNQGLLASKTFSLSVSGAPTITTVNPLVSGTIGTAYSTTLAATGSTTPYTWSLITGSLPASLSLSTNGVISGTPSAATNASFTVQVVGANGMPTNKAFSLMMGPAIITTNVLPPGITGVAYSQSLIATGGVPPYTWNVASGGLPAGLAFTTNGFVAGTPTVATNSSFTAQVTDGGGTFSSKTFSLVVATASPELAAALDRTNLLVTSYGNLPWVSQTNVTHDGVDAAKSGAITHSQQSVMETTVQGPGDVNFWWKVSSESGYDYLTFYIDGVMQSGRISGTVDWQPMSFAITNGSHSLKWIYSKDSSVNSGSDCGWVDQVMISPSITTDATLPTGVVGTPYAQPLAAVGGMTPYVWTVVSLGGLPPGLTLNTNGTISGIPSMATNTLFIVQVTDTDGSFSKRTFRLIIAIVSPELAEALDQPGKIVTTSGMQLWVSQTNETHDGLDAAKSGGISHSQDSRMETIAQGPGDITFWWKVSSETNWDTLTFYIDDVMQGGQISGTVDWQLKTYPLTNGSHMLKWVYSKNTSITTGADCGWVDQLTLPNPVLPPPTLAVAWSNGWPQLNISGSVGSQCVLHASSNLVNWSAISTSTVPAGGVIFIPAPGYTNNPVQFYRAMTIP